MPIHVDDLSTEVTLDEGETPMSEDQLQKIAARVSELLATQDDGKRDLDELTKLQPQSASFLKLTDPAR